MIFEEEGERNPYFSTRKDFGDVDKNRKYEFLVQNKEELDKILNTIAHKRGFINVLLNEGYATNMLNSRFTVNPDSTVIARNPRRNPGNTSYKRLGNFGLDNLEPIKDTLSEELQKKGTEREIFDNIKGVKLWGLDHLSLNEAAPIINNILNKGKELLKKKYGNAMWKFFRQNPEAEDRMLYAYYKMPNKFKNRIDESATIQEMYQKYIDGGLNKAFQAVDAHRDVVNSYFKKFQYGGTIAPQDNIRIVRQEMLEPIVLTPIQQIQRAIKKYRKGDVMYDADKADYFRKMQNNYNQNVFGYGLSDHYINLPVTTPKEQAVVQATYNNAKDNASAFLDLVSGALLYNPVLKGLKFLDSKYVKGPFKLTGYKQSLGSKSKYLKNGIIGEGAESIVVQNTPSTVAKISNIPARTVDLWNSIPAAEPLKYVGYVREGRAKFPTYIQNKLRILSDKEIPKALEKLDKVMAKSGFQIINDPKVTDRAYTNGSIVVDDIAQGNIGQTWFGSPRLIDFAITPIPEWKALGYSLKKGGKILI